MAKVLVTRTRKQSQPFADALTEAGFEPVFFPTIAIRPVEDLSALKDALADIEKYDWVLFTSANAVDVFFDFVIARSPEGAPKQSPAQGWRLLRSARSDEMPKVAAVGTKTAEALQAIGVDVSLVPDEFVGEGLLKSLGDVKGRRFLLPRAKEARKLLPDEIRKSGGILDEFAIYETVTASPTNEEITSLQVGVDVVTFTSPSTVNNFVKLAQSAGLDPLDLPNNPLFACIGPVTEKAAREAGFSPLVVAESYTTDGLIEILIKHKGHEGTQSFKGF